MITGKRPRAQTRDVPGEPLSRRFRIEHVVGRGGMGVVVAAHHLALDQRVALKLMLPELRHDADLVRRFLREARTAARLRSPHSARIIDVGMLEDGAPYLVMEYLDGTDVATLLQQAGTLPARRAATIVLHAALAIAEAHALGIVHRDLKPGNLFAVAADDDEPLTKVLDLGVCKHLTRADDLRATSTTATIGTPAYMAPEQLRSARDADARSDIWSLGVILYELVVGVVPFRGQTVGDQCLRASLDPLPVMTANAPRELKAVIARCLQKDPAARFQTAMELAAALRPFTFAVVDPPSPRWRLPMAALAVLLLAGTAMLAWEHDPSREPGPRPATGVVIPSPSVHSATVAPHVPMTATRQRVAQPRSRQRVVSPRPARPSHVSSTAPAVDAWATIEPLASPD